MKVETVIRQIGQTLSTSASPNTLPSQQSSVMKAMVSRYGDRQRFLEIFHVAEQTKLTRDPERCYFGTAPTMGMVNTCYGSGTAQEWLVYQLADLSEFSGAKEKITGHQIKQLADIIATDYHWLKVSEFMLFFRQFKRGEYGKFYGAVDPLTITTALREFLRDRNDAYFKHDQQEREAREARERKMPAITREEYLRRKAAREVSEQKQKEIANITTKVYEHQEPTESR